VDSVAKAGPAHVRFRDLPGSEFGRNKERASGFVLALLQPGCPRAVSGCAHVYACVNLASAGYHWRIFSQPHSLPLLRRDSLNRFDRNLLVAALHAHDHLILIADGHFQFHRVVFLHDVARGADAGMQKAL
jgi:hypothetical protein